MANRGFGAVDNLPICLASAQRLITATKLLVNDGKEVQFSSNPKRKDSFVHGLCLKLQIAPTEKNANKIKVLVREFKEEIDRQINERLEENQEEDGAAVEISNATDAAHNIRIRDISNGLEAVPIRLVANTEELPEPFEYIKENRLVGNVPKDTKKPNHCCDCKDDCKSNETCACRQFNINRLKEFFDVTQQRNLNWVGYNNKRLYYVVETGIFECHSGCKCSSQCFNRVAQQPISHHLEIFRSEQCGWGVRSLNDIPRGAFVSKYLGEVITDEEAERRGDDMYFFNLIPFEKTNNDDNFVVDAKHFGNFSRFYNHSCEPNMFPHQVYIYNHDIRLPYVAFFAFRDIKAGEELTLDYNYTSLNIQGKSMECKCGAEKCRKNVL